MTLTLELLPAFELRLKEQARQRGLSPDVYALRLLEERLQPGTTRPTAIDLLESWIDEGDDAEQRVTGEYLIDALDEDRLGVRRLFPEDLKGVTW